MSATIGVSRPAGDLGLTVVRAKPTDRALTWSDIRRFGFPQDDCTAEVNDFRRANRGNLMRRARKVMLAQMFDLPHFYGSLFLEKTTADGRIVDYGLASMGVVTTVGVKFICDDFNASAQDVTNMKFHGFGTGGGAEAVGNTALTTEVTNTTYVGDVRPTGSQASATVSNDATYTTVATYSPDSGTPLAITEHGIFSANATGTLLDKSLFSVVNLATGDSLQATYVLTMVAGG